MLGRWYSFLFSFPLSAESMMISSLLLRFFEWCCSFSRKVSFGFFSPYFFPYLDFQLSNCRFYIFYHIFNWYEVWWNRRIFLVSSTKNSDLTDLLIRSLGRDLSSTWESVNFWKLAIFLIFFSVSLFLFVTYSPCFDWLSDNSYPNHIWKCLYWSTNVRKAGLYPK